MSTFIPQEEAKADQGLPQVRYFDYKDVETLKRYQNPHGRIMSRKKTRLTAKGQRQLATAVKYARFMGFMPFVVR